MSLDITKTETFVPFLWIISKTILAIAIFSMFSEDAQHWTMHRKIDIPIERIYIPVPMDSVDRCLTVLLVSLVLCERGVDLCIASRSDVAQKVTKKTLTGLNTHIINDIFAGFCLLHYVKTPDSHCQQSSWLLFTTCLWSGIGLAVFVYETYLKRKILHHEQPKYEKDSISLSNIQSIVWIVRPYLLYTSMVMLLAICLTSSCLHNIFNNMPSIQLFLRLLLYACYVCCRCYTQGMPGESIIEEMPNIVLLGWIIMLPVILLYISIMITIAAYVRLISTPNKKHTTLLPVAAVATGTKMTGHPTIHTPTYSTPTYHQGEHPSKHTPENSAEFLEKLQHIEQSMQMSNPSVMAKSTHAAKRRQAPLF